MKFYIKSYEEIKKSKIGLNALYFFTSEMKLLCGKGPFEFTDRNCNDWLVERSQIYFWHISWLMPFPKDKQYLLEF